MKRTLVGALIVAAVAVGLLLAGLELVRERRYQQFLLSGDKALATLISEIATSEYEFANEAFLTLLSKVISGVPWLLEPYSPRPDHIGETWRRARAAVQAE